MATSPHSPTCALILAGGSGTRFWPLSRSSRPKQLLPLMGDTSLLQGTVDRLSPLVDPEHAFYSTTRALADSVVQDLQPADARSSESAVSGSSDSADDGASRVFAEPMGRNTLPAIAWCVDGIQAAFDGQDPVIVVLPSDHYVTDREAFQQALDVAVAEAEQRERIVTLGVPPRWAETGYGYLELNTAVADLTVYDVARFTEKPDAEHAAAFVAGGRHLWNAGIFVFRASVFAARARELQPAMMELVDALREAQDSQQEADLYGQMPNVSIDFGLMEHLDDIGAVPLDCGWNDLGSWDALAAVLDADQDGNKIRGDAITVDARNNVLVAEQGMVAVVGVENLVVVRTDDAVLVLPRDETQEVRQVVAALKEQSRKDLL